MDEVLTKMEKELARECGVRESEVWQLRNALKHALAQLTRRDKAGAIKTLNEMIRQSEPWERRYGTKTEDANG